MTPHERVFDGSHLRADLYAAPSDRLVVTFDFRQHGKTDFSTDAGSDTILRTGAAHLMIRSRRNDWFINAETAALDGTLAVLGLRFVRVGLLGFSMGGYGAFRFAAALGAQTVVSVSPQLTIDPGLMPHDRRYRTEAAGFDPDIGDLARRASGTLRGVIAVDPFAVLDLDHARRLQTLFPRVRLARLAFGDHPATQVLRDTGRGVVVRRLAVDPFPEPGPLLAEHRAARRQSPLYWTRLAKHALSRRPALAERALAEAERLSTKPGSTNRA